MDAVYDIPHFYLISSLLLGVSTFLLLYWCSKKKLDYWKKRGIPHPKSIALFGSTWEIFFKTFDKMEIERYMKYGAIYGHFEGHKPMLSVGDPKLVRDILVKDFHAFSARRVVNPNDEIAEKLLPLVQGEDWKRIRAIITPTFTTGKLKRVFGIFKNCAQTVVNNIQSLAEKGEPIDVKSIYEAFIMDVIASAAFSAKIDSYKDPNNQFVSATRKIFKNNLNWRILLTFFLPDLMKFLKIRAFFPKEMDYFSKIIHQIIEERRKTGEKRNDYIQLLMDTAEEIEKESKINVDEKDGDITENYGGVESNQVIKNICTKKTLSITEIVAQCVIFFMAGYDTTATTLSLATYALALNPDVQEKLKTEVDEVLEANNGEITYEAIQSMKYLDNVIAETMRLYASAIRTERKADVDYKLGDTGIIIPKNMIVTIPICALHKDPKIFPDPEKFDPDRFKPEERAKRDQYVYLPFGAGPRNCVGMRFALLESKVCLAKVMQNFIIKRCPETKVPLDFYLGQIMMQPKAVKVQLEIRKDSKKCV